MNEEIEYAEMLEIPVSTVNVVRKQRRRKKTTEATLTQNANEYIETETSPNVSLKDSVIAQVNDRLVEPIEQPSEITAEAELFAESANSEGRLDFDPIPERIDTVRLYSSNASANDLYPSDYELDSRENDRGRYAMKYQNAPRSTRIALGIEFGLACALCGAIFLTNVFMPGSAINTFFRALNTPTIDASSDNRVYTDFTLAPIVSELSDTELTLSPTGILSFTDECCVYPAADGTVSEVVLSDDGFYTVKLQHSDSFTGVINGLDYVYYAVGDPVKANVPVGFSKGESEVQVTMYSGGQLLNCFELTEENCLAWISLSEK